jgi:NAD(P)H-flavin reductase
VLNNTKQLPENCFVSDDFEFILYASFLNREQSIGLDLCEKLVEMNEKLGMTNFKFTVRLSETEPGQEKPPRWNNDYIKGELTPLAGQMKKVWVCGPPIMNQTFDKAFESLEETLKIKKADLHIL